MDGVEKLLSLESFLYGALITFISFLGGLDNLLIVFLMAMLFDWITGLIRAVKENEMSSSIGHKGVVKRMLIVMLIVFAVALDKLLSTENNMLNILNHNINLSLRNVMLIFYIGNDGISMLENLEQIGVPFPEKLRSVLKQCRDRGKVEDENPSK